MNKDYTIPKMTVVVFDGSFDIVCMSVTNSGYSGSDSEFSQDDDDSNNDNSVNPIWN
jgi:hypothetical protein